ncbi:hypothetical protein C3F00_043820, partial [Pseudomonas sp. MWU13-2860]
KWAQGSGQALGQIETRGRTAIAPGRRHGGKARLPHKGQALPQGAGKQLRGGGKGLRIQHEILAQRQQLTQPLLADTPCRGRRLRRGAQAQPAQGQHRHGIAAVDIHHGRVGKADDLHRGPGSSTTRLQLLAQTGKALLQQLQALLRLQLPHQHPPQLQ